jgi:hypothetical protein
MKRKRKGKEKKNRRKDNKLISHSLIGIKEG